MAEAVKTFNSPTTSNAVANQKGATNSATLTMPSVPVAQAKEPAGENSLQMDDELLVLHGRSSAAANLFSSLKQYDFKNMQDAIEAYNKESNASNLKQIEIHGQAWLDKRKEEKKLDEDDTKKKQSITKILEKIRNRKGDEKLNFLTMSNSETAGSSIFGNVSDFVKIQDAHYHFQEAMAGGLKTLDNLIVALKSAKVVMKEIAVWKGKHGTSKEVSDIEKKAKIDRIEQSMHTISGKFAIKEYFTASISGFDFTKSTETNFVAQQATAAINIFEKTLTAQMKEVEASKEGLKFKEASFGISELSLGGAKVTDLLINLKDKTDSYAFAISGKTLELNCLGVEINASNIGYNNETKELTAEKASAETTVLDKEVKGDVSKLKIDKSGASFETANLSLSGLELGPVKAEGLKSELKANKGNYDFIVSGEKATLEFMGVTVVGEKISYDSKAKKLTVATAEATTTIAEQEVKGNVENIKIDSKGASFEKATLEVSAIDLGLAKAKELKAEIESVEGESSIKVTGKSLSVDFMGVSVVGEEILYDQKSHKLSVETAEAKVTIAGNEIKGTVSKIELNKKGASFQKAKLEVPELDFDFIKAKRITGEVSAAEGKYDFMLLANTVTGNISLFDIKAAGLKYDGEAKEFKVEKATVIGNPFGSKPVTGEVEGLSLSDEGADWKKGSLNFSSEPFDFGGLSINLPSTANFHGKESGYLVELIGAQGKISIGSLFTAEGQTDISWSKQKPVPEIDKAQVKAKADVIKKLPGDFVPGWPINVSVDFPVAPGAFVGFAFKFGGEISVSILGEVNYDKSGKKFSFSGGPQINGNLFLEIAIQGGVGHPLIVSIQAFASAKFDANAKGKLNLVGDAIKKDEKFDYGPILAKYDISAELLAKIKVGLSATAFLVFNKEIYSVEIAEWDLGKAEKSGALGLLNNTKEEGESTGLLSGDPEVLKSKSPFKSNRSNYLDNLKTLVSRIPKKDNTAADRADIEKYVGENKLIKPETAAEKFVLAKTVVDNTPKELLLRKSVLAELKARKLGQTFIREENRQKRLLQYAALEKQIEQLEVDIVAVQTSIKGALSPENDANIGAMIDEFIVKMNAMSEQFTLADKYDKLSEAEDVEEAKKE